MPTDHDHKDPDAEGAWRPSEWGPNDQRGAVNRLGPGTVLRAARLIKEGRVYELGRVYEMGMPVYGDRRYDLRLHKLPSGGPMGSNRLVYYEETISGEISQVGTQLDGLGHVGTRVGGEDIFYNGFKASELDAPAGLAKLGIENVGAIFTRGVLLDIAALKNVDRLDVGYIITVEDIEGALEQQSLEILEGDVILFRTGHGRLWMQDNEAYHSGEPGPGVTSLRWLSAKRIVVIGADNWSVEAVPGENDGRLFEGHQCVINQNGIYLLENLNLEGLASDDVHEFAFLFVPVPFKGAAGSPGNPIAIC
jgi:kynurenine formamidase